MPKKAAAVVRENERRIRAFLLAAVLVFASVACDYFLKDAVPGNISEIEKRVFDLVNGARVQHGLDILVWNDAIADVARGHSKDMADGTVPFGHDGFTERFAAIRKIIPASAGAENVAYTTSADSVVLLWLDSPEHKQQIVGNYDYTGVGVAWALADGEYYFTQIFIRSR
ncbi:MAG: CAP domain-containing protein [Candidatus Aminicenantales bacterium]